VGVGLLVKRPVAERAITGIALSPDLLAVERRGGGQR